MSARKKPAPAEDKPIIMAPAPRYHTGQRPPCRTLDQIDQSESPMLDNLHRMMEDE